MKAALSIPLFFSLLALLELAGAARGTSTLRPVVGVLTQPLSDSNSSEILVSSYVKWVESAGARVVPIRYTASDEELALVARSVNGVLLPGGNVAIEGTPFARAARLLVNLTMDANLAGREVAMWATCLGFEQMLSYSASALAKKPVLSRVDAEDVYLPLRWTAPPGESTLLGGAPAAVVDELARANVTINMHEYGVLWEDWQSGAYPLLAGAFRPLATSVDRGGLEFVSLVEHAAGIPVFGSQFHPEKQAYEWNQGHPDSVHTAPAVAAMQFLADRFVAAARRTAGSFATPEELQSRLIYNWPATFTGALGTTMVEQIYFFSVDRGDEQA